MPQWNLSQWTLSKRIGYCEAQGGGVCGCLCKTWLYAGDLWSSDGEDRRRSSALEISCRDAGVGGEVEREAFGQRRLSRKGQ